MFFKKITVPLALPVCYRHLWLRLNIVACPNKFIQAGAAIHSSAVVLLSEGFLFKLSLFS